MSPYEKIALAYEDRPEAQPFGYYISWHFQHGFVFSTPSYFIMGFPVLKDDLKSGLQPMDCVNRFGDCWYVAAMAGDIGKVWDSLPWPLGWIAFHRDGPDGKRLTLIESERIRRLSATNPHVIHNP